MGLVEESELLWARLPGLPVGGVPCRQAGRGHCLKLVQHSHPPLHSTPQSCQSHEIDTAIQPSEFYVKLNRFALGCVWWGKLRR